MRSVIYYNAFRKKGWLLEPSQNRHPLSKGYLTMNATERNVENIVAIDLGKFNSAVCIFKKTPVKSLFPADFNNFSKSHLHKQLYLFDL